MANRFDYIKYDNIACEKQDYIKQSVKSLAQAIEDFGDTRATQLALTHLEECYMWVGKAIRDEQIMRDKESAQLQEERSNL
jgi:hypothetical protein